MAVDRELPQLPSSVGEARRLLRGVLHTEHRDQWSDAGQLAVSEVVTNALVHAGTPVRLRVVVRETAVRVEVGDESSHLPRRRDHAANASTGRGLKMVQDVVARWGAHPYGEGKVVWFELADAVDGEAARAPVAGTTGDRSRSEPVAVELLNVPLLMHAAWQEHASAVLREHLLVTLEAVGADDAGCLEVHAAASHAMHLLLEQIPTPRLPEDPDALIVEAVDPGMSSARLVLQVAAASVPHFQSLDDVLDDAMALADSGDLLSPPIQPELRAMRRWLCRQVLDQAAAASPTPWAYRRSDFDRAPGGVVDWDPTRVSTSSRALLAADDTDRIVAASRRAVQALGYRDEGDLLGHRLISIIPARYRQAHLAGFTLHLTNGRSPLLGSRVTVPVLRADGTEATTDLLIDVTVLPGGRRVFTAEMLPGPATGR